MVVVPLLAAGVLFMKHDDKVQDGTIIYASLCNKVPTSPVAITVNVLLLFHYEEAD